MTINSLSLRIGNEGDRHGAQRRRANCAPSSELSGGEGVRNEELHHAVSRGMSRFTTPQGSGEAKSKHDDLMTAVPSPRGQTALAPSARAVCFKNYTFFILISYLPYGSYVTTCLHLHCALFQGRLRNFRYHRTFSKS